MLRVIVAIGLAGVLLTAAAPVAAQTPPVVTPMFSEADRVPAFLVECRNTTGSAMRLGIQLRFDGEVVPVDGVIGGGGPVQDPMPAGASWREIVTLHPTANMAGRSPSLGAVLRTARHVPMTPGRHRVAFECAGAWSNDVWFFWDGPAAPAADPHALSIVIARENQCGMVISDPTDINQCPTYTISIAGDGAVVYEGRAGVKTVGMRTHTLSAEAWRDLRAEIDRAKFFELEDRYTTRIMPDGTMVGRDHLVATTVTISVGGRSKTVFDFFGAPDELRVLEQRIDEIAGITQFTGRPGAVLERYRGRVEIEVASRDVQSTCSQIFDAAVAEGHLASAEADAEPRIKQRVEPVYPTKWHFLGIGNDVLIVLIVGETGTVTAARPCQPGGFLVPEALAAARQWVFEPIRRSGQARSAVVGVRVRFVVQ